jgi:hypothetical protein
MSGGSVKAEGLGDGPAHGKSAVAKLRLTLPPTTRHDFAFARNCFEVENGHRPHTTAVFVSIAFDPVALSQ